MTERMNEFSLIMLSPKVLGEAMDRVTLIPTGLEGHLGRRTEFCTVRAFAANSVFGSVDTDCESSPHWFVSQPVQGRREIDLRLHLALLRRPDPNPPSERRPTTWKTIGLAASVGCPATSSRRSAR